jgi:hypothetical protein
MDDLLFLINNAEPYIDLFSKSDAINPIRFFQDFLKSDGFNLVYKYWTPPKDVKIVGGNMKVYLKSKEVKIKTYYDQFEDKDVLFQYNFQDLVNEILTQETQNTKSLIDIHLNENLSMSKEASAYVRKINRLNSDLIKEIESDAVYNKLLPFLIEISTHAKHKYSLIFRKSSFNEARSFILNAEKNYSESIIDLKEYLEDRSLIERTRLPIFFKIFQDCKILKPIKWKGEKKELFTVIKILIELKIIEDPKNEIWNKTIKSFTQYNDVEFSVEDFNKYTSADIRKPKGVRFKKDIKDIFNIY